MPYTFECFRSGFDRIRNRKRTWKPKSKSPTVIIHDNDKDEIHTHDGLELGAYKTSFKDAYSVDEFELLAAQGKYQEAYWAAVILSSCGIKLDGKILENVALAVEKHWPEMYEEQTSQEDK